MDTSHVYNYTYTRTLLGDVSISSLCRGQQQVLLKQFCTPPHIYITSDTQVVRNVYTSDMAKI